MPIVPEFETRKRKYRWHTLVVQIRKYGDARKTPEGVTRSLKRLGYGDVTLLR